MQENSVIQIKNVSKSFKTPAGEIQVLQDISFDVKKGDVFCVIGPNGIGKSTLLNMISGIMEPDTGTITINSKPPRDSKISYIMQNSSESLFPWKTCWDNISFSLELKNVEKNQRKTAAEKLVKELGFEEILKSLDQYPYEMSGGMKQACSIARAILHDPSILLMDEPLANLNFETRIILEDKLLDILHNKPDITSVLVSHDIDEAIYLSSKVLVLSKNATIVNMIDIDLERPRNQSMLKSEKFFLLRNKVFETFRKGVHGN